MSRLGGCIVCGGTLSSFDRIDQFHFVTSDCRPFEVKTDLHLCGDCGLVQRGRTSAWKTSCEHIYQTYYAYPQGSPTDQKVTGSKGKPFQSRTVEFLEKFIERYPRIDRGAWLDIGCGQGHLLRLCADYFPELDLIGVDKSETSRPFIESIEGAKFFLGLSGCETTPKIISMVHVLEHVYSPKKFLHTLYDLMGEEALLLIQVPTYIRNPIDLLIYDHGTFFSEESLRRIVEAIGFSIDNTDYVAGNKELFMVLKKEGGKREDFSANKSKIKEIWDSVSTSIDYLEDISSHARIISKGAPVRIFGSSIGGCWLYSELGTNNIDCFLDQDMERVGNTFLGKPIRPAVNLNLDRTVFPLDPATRRRLLKLYSKEGEC